MRAGGGGVEVGRGRDEAPGVQGASRWEAQHSKARETCSEFAGKPGPCVKKWAANGSLPSSKATRLSIEAGGWGERIRSPREGDSSVKKKKKKGGEESGSWMLGLLSPPPSGGRGGPVRLYAGGLPADLVASPRSQRPRGPRAPG